MMALDTTNLTPDELLLIEEAIKTYQLLPEHVFAFRVHPEAKEAVIVTAGGKKIMHKKGEQASIELSETDKTGMAPDEEMVWDIKLNQRVPLKRRQAS
jgi:hypothetical protein